MRPTKTIIPNEFIKMLLKSYRGKLRRVMPLTIKRTQGTAQSEGMKNG